MKMATEEPIGPCPCKGTLCNNGFGWIMGKMSDLRGGSHSSKHNVAICSEFPEDLMEWDAEDGIFLPPPPPGMSIETIKGFMGIFKATEKDLQKGDSGAVSSEKKHEQFEGEWQDGNA